MIACINHVWLWNVVFGKIMIFVEGKKKINERVVCSLHDGVCIIDIFE